MDVTADSSNNWQVRDQHLRLTSLLCGVPTLPPARGRSCISSRCAWWWQSAYNHTLSSLKLLTQHCHQWIQVPDIFWHSSTDRSRTFSGSLLINTDNNRLPYELASTAKNVRLQTWVSTRSYRLRNLVRSLAEVMAGACSSRSMCLAVVCWWLPNLPCRILMASS